MKDVVNILVKMFGDLETLRGRAGHGMESAGQVMRAAAFSLGIALCSIDSDLPSRDPFSARLQR